MQRDLNCRFALTSVTQPVRPDAVIRIEGDHIVDVGTGGPPSGRQLLAMPPLINAHDHARTVRTSSIGAFGRPLEAWLNYLALLPSIDPYLAASYSLARSALGGAGTVMVHYTRTQGLTDLPSEVAELSRAARDVGVRVGFAVAMRDRNPLVYGPSEPVLDALPQQDRTEIEKCFMRPPRSPKEQMQLVEDVASAVKEGADFDLQYGPAGVQWCTHELLELIAEASKQKNRRVHMHLLETRYQRQWADENYPGGMVRFLDEIGLLSPRLALAHCTWTRPDELELLAERGVTIVMNTSSNLGIRSGIAPLAQMVKAGCRVAMGLDGLALDEDDDALREMRLGHYLQAGPGFRLAVPREKMLEIALSNGRFPVLNQAGPVTLGKGEPADILLLDWSALNEDDLRDDLDPLDLLMARATAGHIDELIVGGRTVVRNGAVSTLDMPALHAEIMALMRTGMRERGGLAAALPKLDHAIGHYLHERCGCS